MPHLIRLFLLFPIVLLLCLGCGNQQRIRSVSELSSALTAQGINIRSQSADTQMEFTAPDGRGIEESVALQGDGVQIDVYRIENKRNFRAMRDSLHQLESIKYIASQGAGGSIRNRLYARHPFIVMVNEEPTLGSVRSALENILGKE